MPRGSSSSSSSLESRELSSASSSTSRHSSSVSSSSSDQARSSSSSSASVSLPKTTDVSYATEARNIAFLFLLPMAFVCILNSIPLNDPYKKVDTVGQLLKEQWTWIFLYTPLCFSIASIMFTQWIEYLCTVNFTMWEYFVAWAVFVPTSSLSYVLLAFLWTFPVPIGSLMATMPGFTCYLAYTFYLGRLKMKARGSHGNFWRLPLSQMCANVIIMEIVLSLTAYNFMVHYNNSGIQIAVTIAYSVAVGGLLTATGFVMRKVAGQGKGSRIDFAHYTLTIWYKTFVMAEMNDVSVLIVAIAIDGIMLAKDVFSFSVTYDRVISGMKAMVKGETSELSTTDHTTDEYSEEDWTKKHELSRAAMLDLFDRLDVDNNGSLDPEELHVLAKKIGRDVDQILMYDTTGKGAITHDDFVTFMLDEVADKKVDKYSAQQWASITAPLYYIAVFTIIAYGPNREFFFTSLNCGANMSYKDCVAYRDNLYMGALYYSIGIFCARIVFNAIAYFVIDYMWKINILKQGVARLAASLWDHVWEAVFATLIMIKFILAHSNADYWEVVAIVAKWSPFA